MRARETRKNKIKWIKTVITLPVQAKPLGLLNEESQLYISLQSQKPSQVVKNIKTQSVNNNSASFSSWP